MCQVDQHLFLYDMLGLFIVTCSLLWICFTGLPVIGLWEGGGGENGTHFLKDFMSYDNAG